MSLSSHNGGLASENISFHMCFPPNSAVDRRNHGKLRPSNRRRDHPVGAIAGVTIQRRHHADKSLAKTWNDLSAKFATGELTHAEIAEAREKSVRRKNTTIPIAVQKLLQLGHGLRTGPHLSHDGSAG
jgi:hypothetical protein